MVIDIYPSADSIPANILRFYIKFSHPMQETGILKHIHLSHENGKNITGVFFDNDYELWNKERTVVTILVDPGRVKKGLFANNTMGWAFDVGKTYALTVDSLLLDFNDKHFEKSYTKSFMTVSADTIAPDIKNWTVNVPLSKTNMPLKINFKDNIDHISACTLIQVIDKNKKVISGNIFLKNSEKEWELIPKNHWEKGSYTIIVSSHLEDIVANSIYGVFDHRIGTLSLVDNLQYLQFQIK